MGPPTATMDVDTSSGVEESKASGLPKTSTSAAATVRVVVCGGWRLLESLMLLLRLSTRYSD